METTKLAANAQDVTAIMQRNDVHWVLTVAPFEGDSGHAYMVGHDGVTEMRIVKRFGPLDFIPYVEVYRGDQLWAELPQHNTLALEFAK